MGIAVLKKMSEAYLTQAITEGTRSWDFVVARVLSVLMQSVIAGRAGDAARSQLYMGNEFMAYKDVELCLHAASGTPKPSVSELQAKITVRCRKGFK